MRAITSGARSAIIVGLAVVAILAGVSVMSFMAFDRPPLAEVELIEPASVVRLEPLFADDCAEASHEAWVRGSEHIGSVPLGLWTIRCSQTGTFATERQPDGTWIAEIPSSTNTLAGATAWVRIARIAEEAS